MTHLRNFGAFYLDMRSGSEATLCKNFYFDTLDEFCLNSDILQLNEIVSISY